MDHATKEGFIRQASRDIVQSDVDASALIEKLLAYTGERNLNREKNSLNLLMRCLWCRVCSNCCYSI